ncbi:MAG: amidohydrolase family protein [Pirellulaceae bacterium]
MTERTTYRARWILPGDAPPLRDGYLTVRGAQVERVSASPPGGPVLDLGDVALLPALVNAHTHLEFSELTEPIGTPGLAFPDWIRQVIRWRIDRQTAAGSDVAEASRVGEAIARGLRESVAAGIGTLGEIATSSASYETWQSRHDNPTGVIFRELIGLQSARAVAQLETANRHLAEPDGSQLRPGLSPHAPYTVRLELLQAALQMARRRNCPVAMHLAESEAELPLLAAGQGPFVELLRELGVWDNTAIPTGVRPLQYLTALAAAPRALVIHGNYLAEDEIAFLATHRSAMTLVHCPRTHAYFGHPPFAAARHLASGVRLALGTDSRASNPDLSLWRDLRFAIDRHPNVDPLDWLSSATLHGAHALGLAHATGSLQPGKEASFCAVSPVLTHDPRACLLEPASSVRTLFLRGRSKSAAQPPPGGGSACQ